MKQEIMRLKQLVELVLDLQGEYFNLSDEGQFTWDEIEKLLEEQTK